MDCFFVEFDVPVGEFEFVLELLKIGVEPLGVGGFGGHVGKCMFR